MFMTEGASADFLARQLQETEKALEVTQAQIQKQNEAQERQQEEDESFSTSSPLSESLLDRLTRFGEAAESLTLANQISECIKECPIPAAGANDEDTTLFAEAKLCEGLVLILLQHQENILELFAPLYGDYYVPLYHYIHQSLLARFRQTMKRAKYPKGCSKLYQAVVRTDKSSSNHNPTHLSLAASLRSTCDWLVRLESLHGAVLEIIEGRNKDTTVSTIVMELLAPLVEKVRFHFVEPSKDRPTTTRMDRLPEWLLAYVREHVLGAKGPYQLLRTLVRKTPNGPHVMEVFLMEVVKLIRCVLSERRFFRAPEITGPRSSPLLLYNAIEKFLQFDKTLQELLPSGVEGPLMGLMATCVVVDDEIYTWWKQREREFVFSTLFDDMSSVDVPKPLANHVSPRAELFCALIRSVQIKASTLPSPGPYLNQVASPLCSQFVDALHSTFTDLRSLLCQRQLHGGPPPEQLLRDNVNESLELINGTRLAANVLLREGIWQEDGMMMSQSDHDLARFGRSLEKLADVMIEEFTRAFVQTILMERCRLASYLMRASFILSSENLDPKDDFISAELQETERTLSEFHKVCQSMVVSNAEDNDPPEEIAAFAPNAARHHVMSALAEKFIEVALDMQNTTPNIWLSGAKTFARDVDAIMGNASDLPLNNRLLDITKLLTSRRDEIEALFFALGGLLGSSDTFLDMNDFASDTTLYEEALSMVRAKGFAYMNLEDAVSILNRRRD